MANQLKVMIFFAVTAMSLMGFGALLAGTKGAIIGLALACAFSSFLYWYSDHVVLSLHHAKEVRPLDSFGAHEIVERLAERAGIPTPRIFIIPEHSPNAFATGRNPGNASIAMTQGLFGFLSYDELEGVLAHEVAHIASRDTLLADLSAVMASAILFLAAAPRWDSFLGVAHARSRPRMRAGAFHLISMSVFSPIAAALVRFAVPKSREMRADEMGAKLSGQPEWLASALRKIRNVSAGSPIGQSGPAMAHLYICDPFSGLAVSRLFNAHPRMEDRVRKLLQMRYGRYRSSQSGAASYAER